MDIGVLGAGAWAQALAHACCKTVSAIILWQPKAYGTPSSSGLLKYTASLSDLKDCGAYILALPSSVTDKVLDTLPFQIHVPVLVASKGFDHTLKQRLSQTLLKRFKTQQLGFISGPNFAHEVQAGLPAVATLAGSTSVQNFFKPLFAGSALSLVFTTDITGAEICGALKNVVAIACGICHGLSLGENARCALLMQGYNEIKRFAITQGAEPSTLEGPCGLGDLILTASSTKSRNFCFGMQCANPTASYDASALVEGKEAVKTLSFITSLTDYPVFDLVYQVIYKNLAPAQALENFFKR